MLTGSYKYRARYGGVTHSVFFPSGSWRLDANIRLSPRCVQGGARKRRIEAATGPSGKGVAQMAREAEEQRERDADERE